MWSIRSINRSFVPALCMLVCLCVLTCIRDTSGPDDSSDSNKEVLTPSLGRITREQAAALVTYLRTVRIRVSGDGAEYPMAWAMINGSCEERAMVLEYVTASSSFPLPDSPFVMNEDEITDTSIATLAENPGIDIATINITGPLIMDVVFRYPDGSDVQGDPSIFYWPYHRSAVVNVEGMLMVIDLSTGEGLMEIDDWARNLVDASITCYHMSEDEHNRLKAFWNTMIAGPYEELDRPDRLCGYTLTPIFTARWDQDPLADQLKWTPSGMKTQSEAFKTFMNMTYGITVEDSSEAFYTCWYSPHDEDWLCEYRDPPYCGGNSGGGLIPP
ncbi:hypothetical protein JW948_08865 [bacterium]|nr:hypothetical protein [bacterium]